MKHYEIPVRKIWSENSYLKPGISKSGRPYLYVSPQAKLYKDQIRSGLSGKEKPLKIWGLCFVFHLRPSRARRDVTNMVKLTEDAISELWGVDDSSWSFVSSFKVHSDREFIELYVLESPEELELLKGIVSGG